MPIYSFEKNVGKCLKSAQIKSYENPWWEFEEIVAVVQPTFSISTDFKRMAKNGWKKSTIFWLLIMPIGANAHLFLWEIIGKCFKGAQIQPYENPWLEFEVILAVVQPIFSISTDFTSIAKSGWK